MSQTRPGAILITPVWPAPGGSGRAMRAWDWLRSLARHHRVHVLVTEAMDGPQASGAGYPAASIRSIAARVQPSPRNCRAWGLLLPWLVLGARRFALDWQHPAADPALRTALADLTGEAVKRIVVFRLSQHEIGAALARQWPDAALELDMDDLESRTRLSVAGALLRLGRYREALRSACAAAQYALIERFTRGGYRTLYLAAREDSLSFSTRLARTVACRPNRIEVPPGFSEPPETSPLRLLFIGTLNYPPNEEAVRMLTEQVLPALRRLPYSWQLRIVGRHAAPELRRLLQGQRDVELIEDCDVIEACYATAHIVLIPLGAGGGTKLKTLEAFAHRRPVISTRHGVRGLGAVAGRHYLQAERPADFARAIAQLAGDRGCADRLAEAGRALCLREFDREREWRDQPERRAG